MRRALLWMVVVLVGLPLLALAALHGTALMREVQGRVSSAPKDGQFIAAGDVQVFVQDHGVPFATPVVLVHGPGTWSESWRPATRALVNAGYHAIAIDLPPFGFSFRPPSGDYSTEAQARRLAAALDSLGLASAVLVVHSSSARAVMELVLREPERATALVLVAADLGLQQPPGDASLLEHALLDTALVRNGVVAATLTNPWATERLVERVMRRHDAITRERVAQLQRPLGLTGTTDAVGRWVAHYALSDENPLSRQPLKYKDLGVPTLLIWGGDDPVTPLQQAQHLSTLLPAAVLSALPGVGHLPHMEDENAFNSQLLNALEVMAPTLPAAAGAAAVR